MRRALPTRDILAAQPVQAEALQFLSEPGYEGAFVFKTGDYTAAVLADPAQDNYIAPARAPDGSAGVWVRQTASAYDVVSGTPAVSDAMLRVDPDGAFTGTSLDMRYLIPVIGGYPAVAYNLLYKEITTAFDSYYHVVGNSIFLKSSTAGVVAVGIYSNAQADVAGASVFGANFGCYVTAAGATGIACEIDSHVTVAGATAYALAIDAVGAFPSTAGIVIQNNNAASTFDTGISFNNAAGTGVITPGGAAIKMDPGTMGRFISASGITCTLAEMEFPSFIVGPTVASTTGLVRIDASAAATPSIKAVGTATNISLLVQGKGTGGVSLVDGTGVTKVRIGSTGIGFYGATPASKPTVTGSRGGNAALTSLLTALSTLGLLTDSSTA